jgi:hypothetical protein
MIKIRKSKPNIVRVDFGHLFADFALDTRRKHAYAFTSLKGKSAEWDWTCVPSTRRELPPGDKVHRQFFRSGQG